MLATTVTPLIRLGNSFPDQLVYAKCEFAQPSGCFKLRGAKHLLDRLARQTGTRTLVVPSMGNTAIGAAVGAKAHGWNMLGVVPESISAAKDARLMSLGVELTKVAGGARELLATARRLADERDGYFVHPHLDPAWTDGYQVIIEQILDALPSVQSLVFPIGGGGLLMGICSSARWREARMRLIGCEAYNYPTYARYSHPRIKTIADGLTLDDPHAPVQARISEVGVEVELVSEDEIRGAMRDLYDQHGLMVEPSSAVTTAVVRRLLPNLRAPICVILTGANISAEDFLALTGQHG